VSFHNVAVQETVIMGAILAFLISKKHANVDLECNGCALHVDDKSSSSEEDAPPIVHRKFAMEEKSAKRNGID
jgi:hypothetical protein